MQVAFPIYMGKKIDPNAFDRRKEFGKLLVAADNGETAANRQGIRKPRLGSVLWLRFHPSCR